MSAHIEEEPPEADEEPTAASDTAAEPPLTPFYDVNAQVDGLVRARAGYAANGEIVRLPIDVTVGLARAEQAHALAYGWYVDAVRTALEQDGGPEEEANADE